MELCSFLTLDSFITDPLTHDFMRKALLMSSLVAAVCGFLSSYLTLKGWALMGDAVSHSVMPGVVVAYALGLPFSLGAFIFGVGSVALIGLLSRNLGLRKILLLGWYLLDFLLLELYWFLRLKVILICTQFYLAVH